MTLRIAIVGSKELACQVFDACLRQNHKVVAVFTRDSEAGMRIWHNELGHRSLFNLAQSHGVEAFEGVKINSNETQKLLQSLNLDVIFSCFWSEILKETILSIPKLGVFNIHSAKLPSYRGSRPIPWAIINGEKTIGITLHKMLSGVDNGPIVSQSTIEVLQNDTSKTIYEKLTKAGALMFEEQLTYFKGNTFTLSLQNEKEVSYYPPGEPYNGCINPFWKEELQDRFIRAFTFPPFEGVKSFYTDQVFANSLPTVSFVEQEKCFIFNENTDLKPVFNSGPVTQGNYFKFLLRQSQEKFQYFLSNPFDSKLSASNAVFSLKKNGFKALFEETSFDMTITENWRLLPHFIENGLLKVPIYSVSTMKDFNQILDQLTSLKTHSYQRIFIMFKCSKSLQAEFKTTFDGLVNIINNETFISCFRHE